MPARKVAFAQGEYYHIYNRGAGRLPIFRQAVDFEFVLGRMQQYARSLRVSVLAYCLLPNHYHLLVRQDGGEPVGLLPQRVFNSYAKAFNRRYERSGTLFEGRYEAIHVDREAYLIHLCRYIHANPVKHGLVTDLADWPHTNYHEWIGRRNRILFDGGFARGLFPDPAEYMRFVTDYVLDLGSLPGELEAFLCE